MRALHTAATGMMAQELNVDVISNNIANLRTTGFKRQRVHFQDLLYENLRRSGAAANEQGQVVPAGVSIGSGVKTVSTGRIMGQGNLSPTEKTYDLAIRGEGFFRIQMPDGRTGYTRDGSFELDPQGQLVTKDGYVVDPQISVPQNATSVTVNNQGVVQAFVAGETAPRQVGQITLARFVNKTGLDAIGDNLFVETPASGPAIEGAPGSEGVGSIQQGHLEEANVQAVTELSTLIAAQRAYEMNAKVVAAADQMLTSTSGMLRG